MRFGRLPGNRRLPVVGSTSGISADRRRGGAAAWTPAFSAVAELPAASLSAGTVPQTVYFTDQTAGRSAAATYLWNFGDGTTSTARHPTHTYTVPGTYSVSLTVTDGSAAVTTVANYVTVAAATTPADLFGGNLEAGVSLVDAVAAGKVWSDTAGTTPAVAGSGVGRVQDPYTGRVYTASGSNAKPILCTDGAGRWAIRGPGSAAAPLTSSSPAVAALTALTVGTDQKFDAASLGSGIYAFWRHGQYDEAVVNGTLRLSDCDVKAIATVDQTGLAGVEKPYIGTFAAAAGSVTGTAYADGSAVGTGTVTQASTNTDSSIWGATGFVPTAAAYRLSALVASREVAGPTLRASLTAYLREAMLFRSRRLARRETFAADVTPGSPGTAFHYVSDGTGVLGNRPGGPGGFSGSVPVASSAELSAGYTRLRAGWQASSFGLPSLERYEISGWFRFDYQTNPSGAGARLFSLFNNFTADSHVTMGRSGADLSFSFDTGTVTVTGGAGKWVWVSFGWVSNAAGSSVDWALRVKTLAGAVQSVTGTTAVGSLVTAEVWWRGTSFQPTWDGRVGSLELRTIDAVSDTASGPAPGPALPSDADQYTFAVDPVSGSDASIRGPYQTMAGVQARIDDRTINPSAVGWKYASGGAAGYATFADDGTTADRDAKENRGYAIGAGTVVPAGDTITWPAGAYRLTSGLGLGLRRGMTFRSATTGQKVRFCTDVAWSPTWTRPNAGTYPNLWRCAKPVGGNQWSAVYAGAFPNRTSLSHCKLTDATAATIAVNARAASAWTGDATYWYCHAPGDVDPNTLTWEYGAFGGGFNHLGALVRDVEVHGGLVGGDGGGQSYLPFATYQFTTSAWTTEISALIDCGSYDAGKHGFAWVGGANNVRGLLYCKGLYGGLNPESPPTADFGWGTGGWTWTVVFSDSGNSPTAVVVFDGGGPDAGKMTRVAGGVQSGTDTGVGDANYFYSHNNSVTDPKQFARLAWRKAGTFRPYQLLPAGSQDPTGTIFTEIIVRDAGTTP